MIFKHKRTGVLYRVLCMSYDVSRQEHHYVYISLETGQTFNRSVEIFAENFELIESDPQATIVPKEPHK